jgi:hypothetical protein
MIGVSKPALEDRRGRRQREKRQADRLRQHEQQPAGRVPVGRRLGVGTDGKRQGQEREQEHDAVGRAGASRSQPRRDAVRVRVSGEQQDLEEEHTRVPDHRRTAENRQHGPGDHRLDGKHQQRAEKQRRREQPHDATLVPLHGIKRFGNFDHSTVALRA